MKPLVREGAANLLLPVSCPLLFYLESLMFNCLVYFLLSLSIAEYRPHVLEDSPQWSSDPLQWESGRSLTAIVFRFHPDRTADALVLALDRPHYRTRIRILDNPFDTYFNDGGSGLLFRERK